MATFDELFQQQLQQYQSNPQPAAPQGGMQGTTALTPPPAAGGFDAIFQQQVQSYANTPQVQAQPMMRAPNSMQNDDTSDIDGGVFGVLGALASAPMNTMRGLVSGVKNMGNDMRALGMLADTVTGDDAQYDQRLTKYMERSRELNAQRIASGVATWDDVKNFEGVGETVQDVLEWMSFATGEMLPLMGSVITGAGGAGVAATKVAGKAITRGVIQQQVATRAGQAAGAFLVSAAAETAGAAGEQALATGEITPEVALLAGAAAGVMETMAPLGLGRAFGVLDGGTGKIFSMVDNYIDSNASRLVKAGKSALTTGLVEGGTELAQEAIMVSARSYVDENYSWASPDVKDRLLESFFTGLASMGMMGGIATAVAPNTRFREGEVQEGSTGTGLDNPSNSPVVGEEGRTTTPSQPSSPTEVPVEAPQQVKPGMAPVEPGAAPVVSLLEELGVQAPQMRPTDSTGMDIPVYVAPMQSFGEPAPEFMEFLEPADAYAKSVDASTEFDSGRMAFIGISKEGAAVTDRTALLQDFVRDIRKWDDSIQARTDVTKVGPERLVEVVKAWEDGDKAKASELYKAAVREGLRIKPKAGEGYMTIGSPKQGMQPVRVPTTGVTPDRVMRVSTVAEEFASTGFDNWPTVDNTTVRLIRDNAYRDAEATHDPWDVLYDYAGIQPAITPVDQVRAAWQNLMDTGTISVFAKDGKTSADFIDYMAQEAYVNGDDLLRQGFSLKINKPINPQKLKSYYNTKLGDEYVNTVKNPISFVNMFTDMEAGGYNPDQAFAHMWSQLRNEPNYQGIYWEVSNGTLMKKVFTDATAAKPGKVRLIADSRVTKDPKNKAHIRTIARVMQKLYNTMGMKSGLTVVINDDLGGNSGQYWSVDQHRNQHIIMVNLNTARKEGGFAKTIHTMLHEFGHYVTYSYLFDPKVVESGLTMELWGAYQRALKRAETLRGGQWAAENFTLFRGLQVYKQGSYSPKEPLAGNEFIDQQYKEYLLSFDEWMAEQLAKYFEGNVNEYLGTTERFFGWLRGKIAKMHAVIKQTIPEYKTEVVDAVRAMAEYAMSQDKGRFDIAEQIVNLQYNAKVWSEELGVYLDKSAPSAGKKLVNGLLDRPDLRGPLNEIANESGRTVKQELKVLADAHDHFNTIVKWGWNVQQMAMKNRHISYLQSYVDAAQQWANEKNFWQSMANDSIRHWQALGKDRADRLGRVLFALDSMTYLKPGEAIRQPTQKELEKIFAEHKMDAAMIQVYNEVKDSFTQMLARLEQVSIQQARRHVVNPIAFELEKLKIAEEFRKLRAKPYFPHSRFGNYAIIVTSEKTGKAVYVEHVETGGDLSWKEIRGKHPRSVMRMVEELKKEYGEGYQVAPARVPETVQVFQGMPPNIIQHIKEHLSGTLTEEDKVWMDTLSAKYAPSVSFRHRLVRRTNTPGYSQDAMRSYASYFWHGSNHMARITYGQEMKDVITEFGKDNSRRLRQGINVYKRGKMIEFLNDHVEAILNPKPDWAQLRSMAFTWYLGFMPASALLNFTQLPIVTLPYLSSRFGDAKAVVAMQKAAWQLRRSYTNPEEMAKRWNPLMARMIEVGLQQNFLEESMAMELAAVAEGGNFVRARYGSATQRSMAAMGQAAGWMFQGSEKINRRVTFISAVQLALANPDVKHLKELQGYRQREFADLVQKQGFTEAQARAFLAGKDAVERTQFEYGVHARPRFMRGRKGVIFTFYMFLQNMLFNVGNMPGRQRMLLTMFLMGGMMGLPGAEDIEELVEFAGRKLFGKRFKASEELRRYLLEVTGGPRAADLLLHGTGREGFGIGKLGDLTGTPLPYFDMSGSVGMGSIVPGLGPMLNSDGASFEETLGQMTTDVAGASFGIGINIMKALNDSQLPMDDPKRWERAMPRALKSVIRGARYMPPDVEMAKITGQFIAPEGRERTRGGNTVIAFDGNNAEHMAEIAMVMMGFQPTRLNRKWDDIIARAEVENYWQGRRSMLTGYFWQALATEDPEMKADVLAAIKRFNAEVPFQTMAITKDTLSRSVKTRTQIRAKAEAGLPTSKMYTPLHLSTSELFVSEEDMEGITVEDVKR